MVKKTVTENKRKANKHNSRKSTGPRSARGKRISSFNATTSGLFAKQSVIPHCDGEDAEVLLAALLSDLRLDFQPEGVMENWLLEQMADCMWRLRRAKRAERGSCLSMWGGPIAPSPDTSLHGLMLSLVEQRNTLAILEAASRDIQNMGAISKERHAVVGILLQSPGQPKNSDSKESNEGTPLIDEDFKQRLEEKQFTLRFSVNALQNKLKEVAENLDLTSSLPPAEDMDKILRFEKRVLKKLEWAWLKLLELQRSR